MMFNRVWLKQPLRAIALALDRINLGAKPDVPNR